VNSFYQAGKKLEQPLLMLHKQPGRRDDNGIKPVLLHSEGSSIPVHFSNARVSERLTAKKIIHLPLEQAVLPPRNNEPLSSGYVYNLKKNISAENIKLLSKALKKASPHFCTFILMSMPRTNGSRTQLLLQFSADKRLPHPLTEKNNDWKVDVFRLNRLDPEYLLERGGSDYSLQNKHVTVIGCGSVGGEIAYMLAKGGCGTLTLIDDDYFESDNIYRHRLGGRYLNFKPKDNGHVDSTFKVNALKQSLMTDLPHVDINAVPNRLNLENKTILPTGMDLVVVAVGSPSENSQINKIIKEAGINNAVFCWNEAASIGGHAIALDLSSSCYECLHSQIDGLAAKTPLSLVEPGQTITKNITGCAGVFTPFSYLDSVRTAEIATQLAINLLLKNKHSIARSWKGPNNSDICTTERYQSMAERESTDLVMSMYCSVCNE
jgi:molybdopterin/thiamine biosynthesis adenylyltransferase